MNNLLNIRYNQFVTADAAPKNSICEICKKPAIYRCWVTGGPLHGETGLYCVPCAEEYASYVEYISKEAMARKKHMSEEQVYCWMFSVLSEGAWKTVRSPQRDEEAIYTLKDDEVCQIPERHNGEIVTWADYNGWVNPTFPQ